MNKLICKHKNKTLTLVSREIDSKIDRIIVTHILKEDDMLEMVSLHNKIFINLKSGLSNYMVDGYENESKNLYYYPPAK